MTPKSVRGRGRRAAWAAGTEDARPSPPPENTADLSCHFAGPLGDVSPAIAQGNDSGAGQGVVPVNITPPVVDQVRGVPVEFHGNAELLVQVVQIPAGPAQGDLRLSQGYRQLMGPFDASHISVLQVGLDAIGDRSQPGNQLIPVADLHALLQRHLETRGRGKPTAACPAEPVKGLVIAVSCLGEVDDRLLDPRPRREQDGMAGDSDAARSVDDHVDSAANALGPRYRHMNGRTDPVGEAIQFSRTLMAENGAST